MESLITEQFKINLLREAIEIFRKEGVRALSEEDLIRKLNISYPSFREVAGSKEELFKKAIEQNFIDNRVQQEAILQKYPDPIQQLMELLKFSLEDAKKVSPSYIVDFMSFPGMHELINRELEEFSVPLYQRILNEGIRQRRLRADINIDVVTKIIMQNVYLLLNFNVFPPDKYSSQEVLRCIYLYYFRGLAEADAAKTIDQYFV
jgi:AcrR family transcriptional regulator